jgi:hypothetical protein
MGFCTRNLEKIYEAEGSARLLSFGRGTKGNIDNGGKGNLLGRFAG